MVLHGSAKPEHVTRSGFDVAWMMEPFHSSLPMVGFNFQTGPASWTAGEKLQQPCTVRYICQHWKILKIWKHSWLKSSSQRDLARHPAKTFLTSAESSVASYSLKSDLGFPKVQQILFTIRVFHTSETGNKNMLLLVSVCFCVPLFNHNCFKNKKMSDLISRCPCIWFDSPLTHRAYQKHCSCPKTNSFTSVDHCLAVLAAHQRNTAMYAQCKFGGTEADALQAITSVCKPDKRTIRWKCNCVREKQRCGRCKKE